MKTKSQTAKTKHLSAMRGLKEKTRKNNCLLRTPKTMNEITCRKLNTKKNYTTKKNLKPGEDYKLSKKLKNQYNLQKKKIKINKSNVY